MFLEEQVNQQWPVAGWGQTRLLVAVSGGADSVALLHALLRLSITSTDNTGTGKQGEQLIDVAHFNHGWRGEASDQDEAFVVKLCQRLGVRVFVGRSETGSQQARLKTEEHARESRYAFLAETAYSCGARYVVTGHTANDRAETVLHNLFRGTGLAGVAGPTLIRQLDRDLVLVRPLIGCWREQITEYLSEIRETFRQDASNDDISYRRNFLRHEVLTLLRREYGEQIDNRLCSFSELAEEALLALRDQATEYLRLVEAFRRDMGLVGDRSSAWFPNLSQLNYPWVVVREGLRIVWLDRGWKLQGMTREHWGSLRELMTEDTNSLQHESVNLPEGRIARREGRWVKIS